MTCSIDGQLLACLEFPFARWTDGIGFGPPRIRYAGQIRYRLSSLARWVLSHETVPQSPASQGSKEKMSTPANPNAIQNAFSAVGMNLNTAPLSNLPVFDPAVAFQKVATFTNQSPSYMDPNFRNPRALQWQASMAWCFSATGRSPCGV